MMCLKIHHEELQAMTNFVIYVLLWIASWRNAWKITIHTESKVSMNDSLQRSAIIQAIPTSQTNKIWHQSLRERHHKMAIAMNSKYIPER